MRKGCYDCARAEWDREGATCGINGLHVDRPSLGCNKRVPEKRMTNGDRIRAMTDEELAEIVRFVLDCEDCTFHGNNGCSGDCYTGAISWLKKAVKVDD